MTFKVPVHSVTLGRPREGNRQFRVSPEIGKPFDFTDEEIAQIEAKSPGALRDLINEDAGSKATASSEGGEARKRGRPPGKGKGGGLEDL